jgi:hypothetical protein
MSAYDPQSNDAMFARIMERLDELKSDFRTAREDTDQRLRSIEGWRNEIKGRIAVVALLVSTGFAVGVEIIRGFFSHK